MGKRSQRARRQARQSAAERCGSPAGCVELALHVVVDPVLGGRFAACRDHWPDLAAVIFAEGGWISECPCPECIGLTQEASS